MKKFFLLICFSLVSFITWSQVNDNKAPAATQKIIAYFNRPVNNNVSTVSNAIYLNNLVDDTLIAYINRAKYSLDFAVYSYNETSEISSISTAVNNAYLRGVAIRWIYDGSSSNPSLSLLDTNINTLASPTSMQYGIMHNKFMIIDAHSPDNTEPTVWTGSTNFTKAQINTDANNVVIIQDQAVALAYTTEFNEMWGDSGLIPNPVNSKFGPYKSNNTPHYFNVGGVSVEVYFSPSDGTNSKLQQAMGSADLDMYFGIYSFTVADDADTIIKMIQNGVYTAGIIDPTSSSYAPYAMLTPVMGNNLIKDNITGLYHNKMLIVDPSAPSSDPLVLTGSHNWSASADTKNDENTIIIHSASLANIYYQYFYQNFTDQGGTLIPQTHVASLSEFSAISIYPNPCSNFVIIEIDDVSFMKNAEIDIFDVLGKKVNVSIAKNSNSYIADTRPLSEGLYFLRLKSADAEVVKKLQVLK